MPSVTEPPDKILDLIYDAATDEALWSPALAKIADMTSSVGTNVFGANIKAHRIDFYFNGRLSEEAYRVWRERHFINPLSVVMNYSPVGKLVWSDEILQLVDLKRTAFFDEVFRPQDIAHTAMLPLAAKEHFQAGFSICRSERQGPFDAGEMRLIAQLYPHIRRSLLLGFRLDGYKALQRAEYHVLDRLSVGVILLDRRAAFSTPTPPPGRSTPTRARCVCAAPPSPRSRRRIRAGSASLSAWPCSARRRGR